MSTNSIFISQGNIFTFIVLIKPACAIENYLHLFCNKIGTNCSSQNKLMSLHKELS